ncbi:MAG TPA: TonB-dependent receptor [Methylotenera sp.]|nr:TonB-dependent receptor [Methylotenera sp.]HPV44906.1 TonB-dependent receptor [Methylotenera sp.]
MTEKLITCAVSVLFCISQFAWADHDTYLDSEQTLEKIEVRAAKPGVPANVPNTVESVTAKQIEESANTVTTSGALQYLPSVHVRERYIGDRNGILVMRANSAIASAQTIVYADDLLLSNFLNNSFSTPPRWGMVSPNEIERIDIMYGPFSALYPGNSMGGVLNITTRMPEKFEAHVALDGFTQRFELYGADDQFSGGHGNAAIGSKYNDLSFLINIDHLDSHGQPQTFGNAARAASGGTLANSTLVTGGIRDIDTTGKPRIITSTTGIDHTIQDSATIKLAYDISPTLQAKYSLGLWQNDSDGSVDGYLKTASGQTLLNTTAGGTTRFVRFAGDPNFYTLTATGPSHSESEHWMHGLSLKSDTGGMWDFEAVASLYDQNKDFVRTAVQTNAFDDGEGAVRSAGMYVNGEGTGWKTLDLRGDFRPDGDTKSEHQISFGYHYDQYELESETLNVTNWLKSDSGTLRTNSYGKTQTQALYLQDAWAFIHGWKATIGGRWEHWKAFDGSNFNAANPVGFRQLNYADRSQNDFSPKFALSYQPTHDWILRGSFGKAYRYPSVAEMFQTISLPGNVRANDPNLKPEHVRSSEFTVEKILSKGLWRTSLFYEDKRDALISQTDTTTIPGVTISSIQNIDKIRTKGIETALQLSDLWFDGFDLNASITYVDSEIVKNDKNPFTEGKDQPRIPDWRATIVGVYHVNDKFSLSLAGRYSGNQEINLLYNTTNPNTYGTTATRYTVFDTKLVYKVNNQWTASAGINNLNNYKYYVNPNPYPQRTFFAGMKFDY